MSTHIEWLSANFVDVDGSAKAGYFENDGSENDAPAIRIASQFDGDGIIIEGPIEYLERVAAEITRVVQLVKIQHNEDWVQLSTASVADMSEVFAAQAEDYDRATE